MAIEETGSIFNRQIFSVQGRTMPSASEAAKGFTRIFAAKLSEAMRHSLAPDGGGALSLGGGPADVYGTFLDQVMGAVIASSDAMKPINKMIEKALNARAEALKKEIDSPSRVRTSSGSLKQTNSAQVKNAGKIANSAGVVHRAHPQSNGTSYASANLVQNSAFLNAASEYAILKSDSRGPILLPPPPNGEGSLPAP